MSLYLFKYDFYPQLFDEADGDGGGAGGGSGGDGDDKGDDNADGDDKKEDDPDKKSMIDLKDIKGEGDDKDADDKDAKGDDDKKEADDKKKAERPEDIPEKFWDPEKGEVRIDALNKAYKDLESKLGNNKKAPDEYKLEIGEDLQKIFDPEKSADDPLLNWFKDYAKENNFSQDMFNGALEGFGKNLGDLLKEQEANAPQPPDIKEEKEKLGKNADAVIENQVDFIKALSTQGHIDDGQLQEMLILTETADGIKALQAIREYYGDRQNIPQNLTPTGGRKTHAELQTMMGSDKYGNDKQYTDMVDTEYEKVFGKGQSGESMRSSL